MVASMAHQIARPQEVAALSRLALFAGLEQSELSQLAAKMEARTYHRGEVIFRHDDPAGCLYIPLAGRVKIRVLSRDGTKERIFGYSIPGSFFGALGVLDEGNHQSDAIATDECAVLVLDKADLRSFLRSHPEVLESLVAIMTSRWRGTMQAFYDFSLLDVKGRLAKRILFLHRQQRILTPESPDLLRGISQKELAAFVGATRESVHKWLRFFAKQGWIATKNNSIEVRQPQELQRLLD
jgi:CRP-like cAMP-binding protein